MVAKTVGAEAMMNESELVESAVKLGNALANEELIPFGRLASYESVGRRLGLAAWTVGQACFLLGRKYGPTDIPYHRVIHKDGRLPRRFTGGGGVARHRALLAAEGHDIEELKVRYRVEGFEDCLLASPRRRARRRKK